jgi:hypothetical protein
MQTFIMYVVITILMSAVLVGFGAPFIAMAILVYRVAAARLSGAIRLGLACGIAALGVAPSYDAYGGPLPIYVRLLRGEPVTFAAAALALIATWIAFVILVRLIGRRRPAHA